MKKLVCLILFFSFTETSSSQGLSQEADIFLLTIGPGQALYSCFGHSALWVLDKTNKIDEVYNYGTFDFDEDNFYLKFVLGNLKYKLSIDDVVDLQRFYGYEGRFVNIQKLILSNSDKQKIYDRLKQEYKPENRYYLYDFKSNNCATRIADVLFDISEVKVDSSGLYKDSTFRDLLHVYLSEKPWLGLGIDLILGRPVDEKVDLRTASFLPNYLSKALKMMKKNNKKISSPSGKLLRAKHQRSEVNFWDFPWFSIGLFFTIAFFLRNKGVGLFIYKVTYTVTILISILLLFLVLFTLHPTTKMNFNLLWANPILGCMPFLSENKNIKKILLWIYFSQVLFYLSGLHGQAVLVEVMPLVLFLSYYLIRRNRRFI
ncbi:MAG: DUF4105 domain-containing protein [Bacteroidota bacterium]|nr:DUF4105 domain-containing protein [Bacteroidota bacterium]